MVRIPKFKEDKFYMDNSKENVRSIVSTNRTKPGKVQRYPTDHDKRSKPLIARERKTLRTQRRRLLEKTEKEET